MQVLSYTFIDKSEWARGPWDCEPDELQWTDKATGLPCLVRRHPEVGHLCGYVGVTEGHPYFGVPHDRGPESTLDVHGGITFSALWTRDDDAGSFWIFGFDCGHAFDVTPGTDALLKSLGHPEWRSKFGFTFEYRTLDYVRDECRNLARQLRALNPP